MSRMMTSYIHQEGMIAFIIHIVRLLGRQSRLPRLSENDIRVQRQGRLTWFLLWLKGQAEVKFPSHVQQRFHDLNSSLKINEGVSGFSYQLAQMWVKQEGQIVWAKSLSVLKYQKIESDLYYIYMQTLIFKTRSSYVNIK